MDLNNGKTPVMVVRQHVIEALRRVALSGQLWLGQLNRLEAIFVVGNRRRELPLERIGENHQTTELYLLGSRELSDEAVDVFCDFLQERPCHLVSLRLQCLPRQQLHRMLQALHHNTSVKELAFMCFDRENVDDSIEELLRHKSDLTRLEFRLCRLRISDTLAALLSGLTYLKDLVFCSCAVDDEDLQVILNRKYPSITKFAVQLNQITPHGLGFLARKIPEAFPSLERLRLAHNRDLLNSLENTRLFAQNVMPMLKELDVSGCGGQDIGYIEIIKACEATETIGKLEHLNMFTSRPSQAMRNQVIESIRKMKVERLHCAYHLFAWSDPALIAVLYKNTSIIKTTIGGSRMQAAAFRQNIAPILQRNKLMTNIGKDLLRETSALPTTDSVDSIITPLGRWSRVLAEIGHERVGLRATPVYMILQAVLAQWVEPMQRSQRPQQMFEPQLYHDELLPSNRVAAPDLVFEPQRQQQQDDDGFHLGGSKRLGTPSTENNTTKKLMSNGM